MVSVINLKIRKSAKRIVDAFYSSVLGRPRLRIDSPKSLRQKNLKTKHPYLKAYRN